MLTQKRPSLSVLVKEGFFSSPAHRSGAFRTLGIEIRPETRYNWNWDFVLVCSVRATAQTQAAGASVGQDTGGEGDALCIFRVERSSWNMKESSVRRRAGAAGSALRHYRHGLKAMALRFLQAGARGSV
jgi:hypothetical protein